MCSSDLVRAVIVGQLLERVGLSGLQKRPQVIFGDAMFGVGDVGLFEHAELVFADEIIRDVFLERQLRRFLSLGHGQSFPASSRARASRTASCSLRSSSTLGSSFFK